jgi:hypothetical protein
MSTIKRIQKLEAAGKSKRMSWKEFVTSDTWPDYPRGFETLAEALTDVTGQATTPADVEKCLGRLSNDCT